VKQTIPVTKAGPMVLLYPEWLPGNHAPRGQLEKIAGLVITAGGKPVKWVRDPVEVYAFHVDVPEGATALDLSFEFLSATAPDQGRVVVTNEMLNLQWNSTAFYPAGWYVSRIPVEASVTLPDGWKFGVALDVASQSGGKTTFKPVSFETLVDSPMFAGRYFRQVELDRGGRSPVMLNIVADRPEQLDINAEQLALHRNLVVQADRLFGRNYVWSVLGAGRNQLQIAAQSVALGGNVRVGLEDSLWIGPGQLAKSNAEQVARARTIIEGLGLQVATPDEARAILQLKGQNAVGF
jgi:predicted metalloprotease with PDZ domain